VSFDRNQFKRLERAGYDRLGPRYLAAAGTRDDIATALLAAAALAPGQRVLDLASGPGLLARAAAESLGGRGMVLASDISQGQLACCPTCRAWPPTARRCRLPTPASTACSAASA
jgi:ubiquinone/menaquinone biosynthesis C-methylase UbiE